MARFKDITGQRFGRLTVVSYQGKSKKRISLWLCDCDCGCTRIVLSSNLRNGHTKSCGCLQREVTSKLKSATKHGMKGTPEYAAYHNAKRRCNSPASTDYKYWGGRGIEFKFNSFEEFLVKLGTKPSPKHSIDRKDNNGHYEPDNVKWATASQQMKNRRPFKRQRSAYV
jgi:hypothetical protein